MLVPPTCWACSAGSSASGHGSREAFAGTPHAHLLRQALRRAMGEALRATSQVKGQLRYNERAWPTSMRGFEERQYGEARLGIVAYPGLSWLILAYPG